MKMRQIQIIMIVLLVLAAPGAYASVQFTREIPATVYLGEEFRETIVISGHNSTSIEERVPSGVDVMNPKDAVYKEDMAGLEALFIKQNIPGGEAYLERSFIPNALGRIHFQPILISNQVIPAVDVRVECRSNGACGPGENYQTCPADCSTGGSDGICDGIKDGRCDPDCISADHDCKFFCGDGTCEESKENNYNCPEDCGGFLGQYAILKIYSLSVDFLATGAEIKSVKLLEEAYFNQTELEQFLVFTLFGKDKNPIASYRKGFAAASGYFEFKIPYSPNAVSLEISKNGKPIASTSLAEFSEACAGNACDTRAKGKSPGFSSGVWFILVAICLVLFAVFVWRKFRKE